MIACSFYFIVFFVVVFPLGRGEENLFFVSLFVVCLFVCLFLFMFGV